VNDECDVGITVRLNASGGGATIVVDGVPETYTYRFGNAVSRYGSLALLVAWDDETEE